MRALVHLFLSSLMLPVVSMWRAYKIPLPALVSADPYGSLSTPLLDRDHAAQAARDILHNARQAGAHALILRAVTLDGAAMKAFTEVLQDGGMQPRVLQSHVRACLDASRDADELLHDALGTKKLKELRRQRNRLAEHGAVHFDVARTPAEVAAALETFLALEASGWKAKRGTALGQDAGDPLTVRADQEGADAMRLQLANRRGDRGIGTDRRDAAPFRAQDGFDVHG